MQKEIEEVAQEERRKAYEDKEIYEYEYESHSTVSAENCRIKCIE
jgi:hypothetical protein